MLDRKSTATMLAKIHAYHEAERHQQAAMWTIQLVQYLLDEGVVSPKSIREIAAEHAERDES